MNNCRINIPTRNRRRGGWWLRGVTSLVQVHGHRAQTGFGSLLQQ